MLNAIYRRRSVRSYLDRPVDRDLIEEVIKAGMHAPSAMNKQPWHFIVCDTKESVMAVKNLHHASSPLNTAPVAIIVCGDTKAEFMPGFYFTDCAAATENMLIVAKDLGLDTCWMGIFPVQDLERKFSEHFKLPEHIKPYAMVALGYGKEDILIQDRFNPDKIHYNKWEEKA